MERLVNNMLDRALQWLGCEPLQFLGDDRTRRDQRWIYAWLILFTASGYLHYIYSVATIVMGGVLFCCLPTSRRLILARRSNYITFLFAAMATAVSIVFGNLPGFGAACLFTFMFIIAFVAREFATRQLFEHIFTYTVLASWFSVIAAGGEKLFFLYIGEPNHRCSGVSSNPNFYGIMAVLALFLCVHRAFETKLHKWFYYLSALVNGVGLYLCGSASLWLVAFGLVFFYFCFTGQKKLAWIFGIAAIVAIVAAFSIPSLMPRLQEKPWEGSGRFDIYRKAISLLDRSPWVGTGFLSFRYWRFALGAEGFPVQTVTLCHNITLDCLLSHGIVGTVLIESIFGTYIYQLFQVKKGMKRHRIAPYGLPLVAATLIPITIYGMIDTTVLWTQSGMVILLLFATVGVDERAVRHAQSQPALVCDDTPTKPKPLVTNQSI